MRLNLFVVFHLSFPFRICLLQTRLGIRNSSSWLTFTGCFYSCFNTKITEINCKNIRVLALKQKTARCKQYVNKTWQSVELHQHMPSPLALKTRQKVMHSQALNEHIAKARLLNGKYNLYLLPESTLLTWPTSSLGNDQNWTNATWSIRLGLAVG